MTPPRTYADDPGTAVSTAPSSPPVQDSATATVHPLARSTSPARALSGKSSARRTCSSPAISSPSGDGAKGDCSSPVVGELQRHIEIGRAERRDHLLQCVLVLAGDAELITLDAHLHLRLVAPDLLLQLLGQLVVDASAELDDLAQVALGRVLGLLRVEDLEV